MSRDPDAQPPAPAEGLARLEGRVEDLEVRLTFMERTLGELDELVREVFDELARARAHRERIEARIEESGQGGGDVGSLEDEVPPHY